MISSRIPKRSDTSIDIEAWRNMHFEIQQALNVNFDPTKFTTVSDGTGTFVSLITAEPQAPALAPFQIYVSPDATGDDAWHTVRVHSGTENGLHAKATEDENKYSDDTDTYANGASKAIDMDMVLDMGDLEANKTNYIILVQERSIDGDSNVAAWAITSTYLCFDSQDPTDNLPFPGYKSGQPDIYKNVTYYLVGSVEVGSDDEDDSDFKKLTINQNLSANFDTNFVYPQYWEPICTTDDSLDPGEDDWKDFYIWNDGIVNPDITITGINDPQTLTESVDNYFWLDYTLDEDTGEVTEMALDAGTTAPTVTTPDPGKAPADIYRILADVQLPPKTGKGLVTMTTTVLQLNYNTVTVGWAVNEDGDVINDLAGIFY